MDRNLTRALLRPRHLALTAVVAILFGAGLTSVLAGTELVGTAPAEQAAFRIPLPREGDAGVYTFFDESSSGGGLDEFAFRWGKDALRRNMTGDLHWTNTITTTERYDGNERTETTSLYAGELRSLALDTDANTSSEGSQEFLPGVPAATSQSFDYHFTQFTDWEYWSGYPCGLRSGLQGTEIPLVGDLPNEIPCWWLGTDDGRAVLRVAGIAGEAPERQVRIESYFPERPDLAFGAVILQEGLAYPIRIENGWDGTQLRGFDLRSYVTGTGPELRTEATKDRDPLGPMELRPRTPWTLDDTGVDHPFALSAAYTQALTDPAFTTLRDFMAAHPDAYVAWARNADFHVDQDAYRWSFGVTDGQAYQAVTIEKLMPAPSVVPLPGQGATFRYSEGEQSPFGDEGITYPAISEVPSEFPAVASLQAFWRGYATDDYADAAANHWGFFISTDKEEGGMPGLYLVAGNLEFRRTPGTGYPFLQNYADTWSGSQLSWYDDWNVVSRLDEQKDTHAQGVEVPQSATQPPGAEPQFTAVKTHGLFGSSISGKEAAGIGFAAFFAAALYWLWPVAKAGGLGLFSRVSTDRLLANPLRAQLLQRIEADPGVHHNALVRDLGKGKGAAEHHLDKLVHARLVLRNRGTGYTCYFPVGTDRRAMLASSALKAEGARRILETLGSGRRGVRELAAATGLAPSTVSHHLGRLQEAGVVAGSGTTGYHAVPGAPGATAAA